MSCTICKADTLNMHLTHYIRLARPIFSIYCDAPKNFEKYIGFGILINAGCYYYASKPKINGRKRCE